MKLVLTVSVSTGLRSKSLKPSSDPREGHSDFADEWEKALLQNAMTSGSGIMGPPWGQKGLIQSELPHFIPFSR